MFGDRWFVFHSLLRDKVCHCLQCFKLGKLGSNSVMNSGVKIIGNAKRIRFSNNFRVWNNAILYVGNKGQIIGGNNSLIGVNCFINAGNSVIKIGNGVAISSHCRLIAYSHHYSNDDISVLETAIEGDIIINDNVLIGSGVTILPGVTIGKGAVIAAGSVILKDVPERVIMGGVPAKLIKEINS